MATFPSAARSLIITLLLTPWTHAQPSDPGGDGVDPLRTRITLEDVLAFDPTDPFFGGPERDRDPVDEVDAPFPRRTLLRPIRSSVTIGYAGTREEEERGWTGSADRALLRADLGILPAADAGFTAEKDAGERWDLGFWSAYLAFRDLPLDAVCLVGDYRVQAGCGLVIGNATAPLGAEDPIRQSGRLKPELVPHRSRDEFGFLRGIALRFSPPVHPRFHCMVFASRRHLPSSGEGESPTVSTNCLFRTDAEIRRKDRIRETIIGGRFSLEAGEDVSCAVTLLQSRLEPAGQTPAVLGLDFSARSGPLLVRGELAGSPGGGIAALVLASVALEGSAGVALAVQSLSASYANHRFESIVTAADCNENSFRLSAACDISSRTRIEGFLRQRWTPSIPRNRLSRSDGWNGGVGGTIDIDGGWQLRLLYRVRRGDDESSIPLPDGGSRRYRLFNGGEAARVSLHYHLGRKTECRVTFQAVHTADDTGCDEARGEQLRQEFVWKPAPWIGISIAGTMFSADAFASRTSSLEDDAISRLHYEPLDGEGFHWALSLTAAPPRTGLTVLALVAGTEQVHRLQPPRVSQRRGWGLRIRWTG